MELAMEDFTKIQRSLILHAETRLVDCGGRLNIRLLNKNDYKALEQLQEKGLLRFGRIKHDFIHNPDEPIWVEFTHELLELAAELRREKVARNLMPIVYRTEYRPREE